MLLQASLAISNTERWALEWGDNDPPAALKGLLRTDAYEVAVVDSFHRIARRYFEQNGYYAAWERPFPTGQQGRPYSVDVSLFHSASGTEVRLELGGYTKAKLKSDAKKLHDLTSQTLSGFGTVQNHVLLWDLMSSRLTEKAATRAMKKFKSHAADVSTGGLLVEPLVASAIDLFVAEPGKHKHAVVALFDIG